MKAYEEKLIEKVRLEPHEIKLDSSKVLSLYKSEKNSVKEVSKKKKWVLPVSLLSSALALASIVTVTVIIAKNNEPKIPYAPDSSNILMQELFSFNAFNNGSSKGIARTPLARQLFKEKGQEENFYTCAKTFEDYYSFFENCLFFKENELTSKDVVLESPYIEGKDTYKYRSDFIYKDETIFSFYYDDLSSLKNKEKVEFNTLYIANEDKYKVNVVKEEEVDENESESEISLIFQNLNNESDIFLIEKEHEVEGNETERSFKLERFNSQVSLNNEEPFLSISFELETEEEGAETNFAVIKDATEFNYEEIRAISNGFSFNMHMEEEEIEESFSNTYLYIDNGTHRYVWETLEKNF